MAPTSPCERWLARLALELGLRPATVRTVAANDDVGPVAAFLASRPPWAVALVLDPATAMICGVVYDQQRRVCVDAFERAPAAIARGLDVAGGDAVVAVAAAVGERLEEARWRHSGAAHVACLVLRCGAADVVALAEPPTPHPADRAPDLRVSASRQVVLWKPRAMLCAAGLPPPPPVWSFPLAPVAAAAAAPAPAPMELLPPPGAAAAAVPPPPRPKRAFDDTAAAGPPPRKRGRRADTLRDHLQPPRPGAAAAGPSPRKRAAGALSSPAKRLSV